MFKKLNWLNLEIHDIDADSLFHFLKKEQPLHFKKTMLKMLSCRNELTYNNEVSWEFFLRFAKDIVESKDITKLLLYWSQKKNCCCIVELGCNRLHPIGNPMPSKENENHKNPYGHRRWECGQGWVVDMHMRYFHIWNLNWTIAFWEGN
jgi:hypothetical protein